MSLREHAMQEFQQKMSSNENIQGMISAYYEMQSGISGYGSSTPMRGILAYTKRQLLFYSEIFGELPISLQIPYHKIHKIKEKKQPFAFFKTIPSIVVSHQDQDVFSTRGNEEEFIHLKDFFEKVKALSN
ncbi:GRAM domain-containing protein [Bacillus cereus group sp. BfR-BA-01315]|uniref:GRAM domain-containing protein n=1 Tax=Bacillus cereus group sp. BfR-BA-01315 TaxID=2920292 RepID=UPI001F560CB1|nr:GRAM domain-containing protein [Bacillus cereus group sp. BfR-BA-01315]